MSDFVSDFAFAVVGLFILACAGLGLIGAIVENWLRDKQKRERERAAREHE